MRLRRFFFLFLLIFSPLHGEEKNSILVCENSLEVLEWNLDFISQAQSSIEFGTCVCGGEVLRRILATIDARMEEALHLQTYMFTIPVLLEKEDLTQIKYLQKKFPGRFHITFASDVVKIWPDVGGVDTHLKMLIVDEHYFSTGGTNFDDNLCTEGIHPLPLANNKEGVASGGLPGGVRDQDIVGRGPLAQHLRKAFYEMYALWKLYEVKRKFIPDPNMFSETSPYFPIPYAKPYVERFEASEERIDIDADKVRLILGGVHQKENPITAEYTRLIEGAQEEIVIGNLYFNPVKPISQALKEAVNRDVSLALITNGANDRAPGYSHFVSWANRVNYTPMFYGRKFSLWEAPKAALQHPKKTQIFEYYVENILYHKKIMVIDRKILLIGSYNLGKRSDKSDYELVVIIESEVAAEAALKVFEKDKLYSWEVPNSLARKWYFDPFIQYIGGVQKRFHGFL